MNMHAVTVPSVPLSLWPSSTEMKAVLLNVTNEVQEGESAPARLVPLLCSVQQDLLVEGATQPLHTVVTDLQYPASQLQAQPPQMYQVISTSSTPGVVCGLERV